MTAVAIGNNANEVIVILFGMADIQRVTVSLTNVNGAGVDASVSRGFMVGDVNSSRAIDPRDVTAMRARMGQPTDLSNF